MYFAIKINERCRKYKAQRSGSARKDTYTLVLCCLDLLSFLNDGVRVCASVTDMDPTEIHLVLEVLRHSDHEVVLYAFQCLLGTSIFINFVKIHQRGYWYSQCICPVGGRKLMLITI